MTRKLGTKVTHHCWCGKTGHCRKHSARCQKHQMDYYASGKCKGCEGEEAAAARSEYRARQDQKKIEEQRKKEAGNAWYRMGR